VAQKESMKLLKRFSLLRRLALAQERTADALERIAVVAEDTWAHKHAPVKRTPAEFGSLDLDWMNERYAQEEAARAAGFELDED
jgi:hypothetical protein